MESLTKTFAVKSFGNSGIASSWTNQLSDRTCENIEMTIPPEFGGPGGTYSPEDLYALSLLNCFLATFKYIAEKSKLEFVSIHAEGILTVGKGSEKALWMEKMSIKIHLNGCPQRDRALSMMEKTRHQCMIINSVKTQVEFDFSAD